MGNNGWSFSDVLPYFLKSEDQTAEEILALPNARKYHSTGGEIPVLIPDADKLPLYENLIAGAVAMNFSHVLDFNLPDCNGFGTGQMTVKDGTRHGATKGLLGPAKNRPNLHLIRWAEVTKVIVNPKTKIAERVEFIHEGVTKTVKARKEVIVSAGAIGSPKILLQSGIGPKEHLREFGIPVIKDLCVGKNLMDHIMYAGLIYGFERCGRNNPNPDIMDSIYYYLKNRTGFFSSIGHIAILGLFQTKFSQTQIHDYPDIQILFTLSANGPGSSDYITDAFRLNDDVIHSLRNITKYYDIVLPLILYLHPKSRGRVSLRSSDPTDPPRIQPPSLTDPNVIHALLEAIETMADIGRHTPGVKIVQDIPVPACSEHPVNTPAYRKCVLSFFTLSGDHMSGTCRMGPQSDPDAVVDDQLRVGGIKQLRVIDASIMPYIVSGLTNTPTIMIAEKGADMIKECFS